MQDGGGDWNPLPASPVYLPWHALSLPSKHPMPLLPILFPSHLLWTSLSLYLYLLVPSYSMLPVYLFLPTLCTCDPHEMMGKWRVVVVWWQSSLSIYYYSFQTMCVCTQTWQESETGTGCVSLCHLKTFQKALSLL